MNTLTGRMVLFGVLTALFILSLAFFGYGNFFSGMPLMDVLLNSFILAIPLVLLYVGIGLVVEAWQQHRRQGRVSGRMARFLYLAPRIAGIVIALFVGLFALDEFGTGASLWEQVGGFLIHAVPSIVMIALLALAWRWAWVGALVFGLAALFFLRTIFSGSMYTFGNLLLFVLPMALIALLFWLNWRWRGEIRRV